MKVETRFCSHCGAEIIRQPTEHNCVYSKRIFCGLKCLGQSQAIHRVSRFMARVDRRGPDECWPWTGNLNNKGYGRFSTSEKSYPAHRLALELSGTHVPPELVVMHSCDNPPCCNPKHLSVGTRADNNRDMKLKGRARAPSGPANHNTKLTPEIKAKIAARRGETLISLAAEFGVSQTTIFRTLKAAQCSA